MRQHFSGFQDVFKGRASYFKLSALLWHHLRHYLKLDLFEVNTFKVPPVIYWRGQICDYVSIFVCLQKMAPLSQHTVLSTSLCDYPLSLKPLLFLLLCLVGLESLPSPYKALTWFKSEAISGTIGTCRSVSILLRWLYSRSSLKLNSCWWSSRCRLRTKNILCFQLLCLESVWDAVKH